MLTISYEDLHFRRSVRSAYVTVTMIPFSEWLFSVRSSCLGYRCIGVPFQNTQTQGNLVKKLHPNQISWGEGLKKTSPSNPSKNGRVGED